MKYTKYATFNCQGLSDENKRKSLAIDFQHHSITVMMLQETRITGQEVYEIETTNGTNLMLYNSGHPTTSYGGTGFLISKGTIAKFQPISERLIAWLTKPVFARLRYSLRQYSVIGALMIFFDLQNFKFALKNWLGWSARSKYERRSRWESARNSCYLIGQNIKSINCRLFENNFSLTNSFEHIFFPRTETDNPHPFLFYKKSL